MKAGRWWVGVTGLVLVVLAIWQIGAASEGLEINRLPSASPPLTIIAPTASRAVGAGGRRPLVLVGHGFAGSSVVMRGFGLSLAHAGYNVLLWDFDGHGANPRPLPTGMDGDPLLSNAEAALAKAEARGLVAPGRVAVLGHSMGSGVALAFGQASPDTAATVAVSPVDRAVTPTLPRNLLLLAGGLETPFVRNAERLLAGAGGAGGDPAAGTARRMVVVPGVEHVSILFAPAAHTAAREWLDATFGPQPGAKTYTDRRVVWYGLGLAGTLLVATSLAPLAAGPAPIGVPDRLSPHPPDHASDLGPRPVWWRLAALAGGVLCATLALWVAAFAGLGLQNLLGLLIGGYLMIWFGVAGLTSLLLLRAPMSLPSPRALLSGLLAFAALWLGVGLLGQSVWLHWLLIPRRLLLWPLGTLLLLPWFLAVGEAVRGASLAGWLAWWLGQSVICAGALVLALSLSPELGFISLILPLLPIILGLHALAAAPYRTRWPFALSGALFVSWLFLAVFPLQ